MFIRDLEYCQIEVSDNQFALVNGGGKTNSYDGKKRPLVTPPAIASAIADGVAIANGTKLAKTEVLTSSIASTAPKYAFSAANSSSAAFAQS